MALGGGNFTTMNKKLPGAYINFVSASHANAELSARGIATMPLTLNWGVEGRIFTVTNEDFQKDSMKLFGYSYDSEEMKGLRDLFIGANTLHAYRLNGGGEKAANEFATALYGGTRGNDLKIVIQANPDEADLFDVITYLGTVKVDSQTVAKAADLVANDFVTFKTDAELTVTASTPLEGGINAEVSGSSYQNYLDLIESYTYNTMGLVLGSDTDESTENTAVKALFTAFNKRMRDEMGIKFQLVLHSYAADYMGVISVENKCTEEEAAGRRPV